MEESLATLDSNVVAGTAAIDFAAREIFGVVRTAYPFEGMDGFAIVRLLDGRTVVGEWDVDELPTAGCTYRFFGTWTTHDRHGHQFRAEGSILTEIVGQAGTVAYLARSGLGLSAAVAHKLWRVYESEAVTILRTDPARVAADGVLSIEVARNAAAKLGLDLIHEPVRLALFELFASRGIPRKAVSACLRTWGAAALRVIRRDPFKLLVADIPGIGFRRADDMAADLGYPMHRLKRQMLAGWYALHSSSSGNTWEGIGAFRKAVLRAAGSMLLARFDAAAELGLRAKWLRMRTEVDTAGVKLQWITETANATAEERLAKHLERVSHHRPLWPSLHDAADLSEHQRERYASIAGSPVAVLAGSPGSGKTYVAAAVLRKLIAKYGEHRIAVCAPTGKAAVRITEAMGRYKLGLTATTIHSALGIRGMSNDGRFQFLCDERNPLDALIVVVDEKSMCDTDLAAALFAALPAGANILLVGDPYQLPPVGHGAPLRDMIAAGVPTALLTEIRRNAGTIVHACAAIKDGALYSPVQKVDLENGQNLAHAVADGDVAQLEMVIALLGTLRGQGFDPIWDVQVIAPRNEGSQIGRKALNLRLQALLNPVGDGESPANAKFRVGDKVICLRNSEVKTVDRETLEPDGGDTYLANGDMGCVLSTTASAVVVRFFTPDRFVTISTAKRKKKTDDDEDEASGKAGDLDLAYGITVHKSQGSEWPVVLVVLDDNSGPSILCRELIYTALSRASRLAITVGQMKTVAKMIRRANLNKRKTFLTELIRAERRAEVVNQ
jgi:exodeoxyribonuclease V alpha subunit